MDNWYFVSTINNLKNTKMIKKDSGDFIELEINDKQILLHKGQYILFRFSFDNFQAVVSKEFFKNNFKIQGRVFVKFEDENGIEYTNGAGLICSLNFENNKEMEEKYV